MPNFVEKFSRRVEDKTLWLSLTLRREADVGERELQRLVEDNWNPLPSPKRPPLNGNGSLNGHAPPSSGYGPDVERLPAFAVDGSVRRANLVNGAYLLVAQALCLGADGFEDSDVELEILRGTADRSTVERFADLLLKQLEIRMATQCLPVMPYGGVLFLDGALHGQLPQLYPLRLELDVDAPEDLYDFPELILGNYLYLFNQTRERKIRVVAVAKTSREATHCKLWQAEVGMDVPTTVPDSEMIHRWTGGMPGYSTPVILGRRGFTGGSEALLDDPRVADAPAFVSFFVRLAEGDDAMRIDIPAYCVECDDRLADLDAQVLDPRYDIAPIIRLLQADYGGFEVYNALLYGVDREVRLNRTMMSEVYLRLIAELTGCEVRLDRSDRRFA